METIIKLHNNDNDIASIAFCTHFSWLDVKADKLVTLSESIYFIFCRSGFFFNMYPNKKKNYFVVL